MPALSRRSLHTLACALPVLLAACGGGGDGDGGSLPPLSCSVIGGGGGSFGIPHRALCAAEIENLLVAGMMITSAFVAHHSTRNTVSCMAQGQAVGTAAALCAAKTCMTRDLKYPELKKALLDGGVYLKS